MRIYLDEDSASGLLVRLLGQAGHDIETPSTAGLSGKDDATQFTHAACENRVMLTRNQDDFQSLHGLVVQTGGVHPGIFIVCRENNSRRDMNERDVVRAIENVIVANMSLENQVAILNHWR